MPIEHKAPTVATVKSLYYHASTCGEPSCHEPLYKLDPNSGQRRLNSTVAHIAARRENGPRWDPVMSEEENRSDANLLVLCDEHSKAIDVRNGDDFPVEMLQAWKQQQIEQADSELVISDAEAEAALASMHVDNSGWVGDILRDAGRGGRGGDASGPGSRAGDGGRGGDIAVGTMHLAPGSYPVKIGKGGTSGRPGGQTSIGDFKVGAPTGSDGIKCTGILANSAELRDGLLYVLGGGWTYYTLSNIPGRVTGCLAFTLELEPDRYPVDEVAKLELLDPSGSVQLSQSIRLELSEQGLGQCRHAQVAWFSLDTASLGTWFASLRIDDDDLLRLPFDVRLS